MNSDLDFFVTRLSFHLKQMQRIHGGALPSDAIFGVVGDCVDAAKADLVKRIQQDEVKNTREWTECMNDAYRYGSD